MARKYSDWYIWSPDGSMLEAIVNDAVLEECKRNGSIIAKDGKFVLTEYGVQLLQKGIA